MPNALPPGYVLPKPGIPKIFGFLNTVFGAVLLVVGLGYIALAAMTPSLVRTAEASETARLAELERQWTERTGRLKRQERAADSKEEHERPKAEREALEASPGPTRVNIGPMFMNQLQDTLPNVAFWCEVCAGVLLNLAMIVAGVGLVRLRPWGRRLALWVAGLKIGRLVAMTALAVLVLIPITARQVRQQYVAAFAQSDSDIRPADARKIADDAARLWAVTSSASSLGLLVFGATYPALTLVFLSRRSARAACQASALAAPRPATPAPPAGPLT